MIQHVTKDPHDSDISYIQSRAEMNFSIIDEYATMMKNGIVFDEVSAFIERGKRIYIYNGAHRLEAARKANKPLLIMLRPGTRANAEWLALSANTKHGLRRSTADKQRVTKNALLHPNATTLSDRQIAKHCQVDHKTVGRIRADLVASGEIPQIAERTVTRNGTEYQQAAKADTRCTKCGQPGEVFYKQLWKCKSCYIEIQEAAAEAERQSPEERQAELEDYGVPTEKAKAQADLETKANTVPTLHCSKCGKETWQKNPPDDPKKILCWHCSPKKAEMIAENEARAAELEAKQTERTAEIERRNAEALARIKAYKDRVTKARKEEILSCSKCGDPFVGPLTDGVCSACTEEETLTPCLACAPTFSATAWARDRARDICPDCLRTLGEAMIEAANEIEIQN